MQVAPKEVCHDVAHLEQYFQTIVEEGGEGIILRDPQAVLKPGRSSGYLKHKVSKPFLTSRKRILINNAEKNIQRFRDAEAKVVAYLPPNQWECEL